MGAMSYTRLRVLSRKAIEKRKENAQKRRAEKARLEKAGKAGKHSEPVARIERAQ